jgi:hypothetical protein
VFLLLLLLLLLLFLLLLSLLFLLFLLLLFHVYRHDRRCEFERLRYLETQQLKVDKPCCCYLLLLHLLLLLLLCWCSFVFFPFLHCWHCRRSLCVSVHNVD